jgi:hypothetical protein
VIAKRTGAMVKVRFTGLMSAGLLESVILEIAIAGRSHVEMI